MIDILIQQLPKQAIIPVKMMRYCKIPLGLYNSSGQLLAIAKLSSPLKKNFASEATIKVKLTY